MGRFLVLSLLGLVPACDLEMQSTHTPPSRIPIPAISVTDLAGYEFVSKGYITESQLLQSHDVARGLAVILNDQVLRGRLIAAMQASPYAEHKLTLQGFLLASTDSPLFRPVLQSALPYSSTVDQLLSQIPEMDFYLPWSEQRDDWAFAKQSPILVGVAMNVDNPVFDAYTSVGDRITLDARHGPPELTTIVIHPAERKSLRTETPQRRLAPAEQCSEPETCGGSGINYDLYFEQFQIFWGDGIGDAEPVYHFLDLDNFYGDDVEKYFGNINEDQWYFPTEIIWSRRCVDPYRIRVQLIEDDQFNDDDWGFGDITSCLTQIGEIVYTIGYCGNIGDPNTAPCGDGSDERFTSKFIIEQIFY